MKNNIAKVLRIIVVVATVYAMIIRELFDVKPFTYFTNLSALFVGIMCGIFLYYDIKGRKVTPVLCKAKFIATISVLITFLLYALFIGPTQEGGLFVAYQNMYWTSLIEHLIIPVAAILDFYISDMSYEFTIKDASLGVVPSLIYCGYALILSLAGVTWLTSKDEVMCMPYNFLNYKAPCGWFGMDLGGISTTTLGIGVAYFIIVFSIIFVIIGAIMLWIKNLLGGKKKRV